MDQPQTAESSVEDRLAAYFAPAGTKATPVQAQENQQVEEVSADQPTDEQDTGLIDQPPEEGEVEEAEAAPEAVEVEYNGKTYKVDPELREAVMLKSDYTQKTQEIASVRRALEVEKMALQTLKVFDQQTKELTAQKSQLESYKEQARKLDWASLTLDQKVDLDRELRNIDSQLSDINGQIATKRDEHKGQFDQFVIRAVMETEKFMSAKVPGWSQDSGRQLHQYGTQLGIPAEKLTTGWFADPSATHVMWKAQQWDKLQASKPGVTNKAASAPPVVKPGSNAVQKSVVQNNYQKAREDLKKSGSLKAFESAFLAASRKR
jgi:hypothetical protein